MKPSVVRQYYVKHLKWMDRFKRKYTKEVRDPYEHWGKRMIYG